MATMGALWDQMSEQTAVGVCTLYGQHQNYMWRSSLESSAFHCLIQASLIKEWDPRVSKISWTLGSRLNLANSWPHLCIFTDPWDIASGLATWSASGSNSNYLSKVSLFRGNNWESLASQIPKIEIKVIHVSVHIKPTIQASSLYPLGSSR